MSWRRPGIGALLAGAVLAGCGTQAGSPVASSGDGRSPTPADLESAASSPVLAGPFDPALVDGLVAVTDGAGRPRRALPRRGARHRGRGSCARADARVPRDDR